MWAEACIVGQWGLKSFRVLSSYHTFANTSGGVGDAAQEADGDPGFLDGHVLARDVHFQKYLAVKGFGSNVTIWFGHVWTP